MNTALKSWKFDRNNIWWKELSDKCSLNRESNLLMIKDESTPLNYYTAFATLEKMIPRNATIVSEGANTMDIGRTMMNNRSEKKSINCMIFHIGLNHSRFPNI